MKFRQNSFAGGLNTQLDFTKSPGDSFPLLINGRTRKNTIAPTNKHLLLDAPTGLKQGLYIIGSIAIIFVAGSAYYADLTASSIVFKPVANWQPFNATTSRIYAELVPASSNRFNRSGTPDSVVRVFNASLAIFQQALFCFDGINTPQAILPDGSAVTLGIYDNWTQNNPNYVPVGILPAWASNKLFLVSPDLLRVYHSVSGRAHDFVINIDGAGAKSGDAESLSQTVSFNPITAVRSLSSGEVLVGTLFGTFALRLDYDHPFFGEPDLIPITLFPAGPVNELSIVDVLKDTAFITQSGIHAFNAVAQAQRESNNYAFGAKIRGLITNPETDKALIQSDTCTCIYDDYVFFAVNTIYGYGALVYDTISEAFCSLDLSFGRVKQYASTKISGSERLFFIDTSNNLYEAFADDTKNATRIYLGEVTPDVAGVQLLVSNVSLIFADAREAGNVKISLYADRELKESAVFQVSPSGFSVDLPLSIPFKEVKQVESVDYDLTSKVRGWKAGAMIEWDFNAQLTDAIIDYETRNVNPDMTLASRVDVQKLCFLADSGYPTNLTPAGPFPVDEFIIVSVTKGSRYAFVGNGQGPLVNGKQIVTEGLFVAAGNTVAIHGSGAVTCGLWLAENYMQVLDAIYSENPSAILHGGDFAYNSGTQLQVQAAKLPIRSAIPFHPVAGNHDLVTGAGLYFYAALGIPRYYHRDFENLSVFFYNTTAIEPDGYISTSIQAARLQTWAAASTKPHNIVVMHYAPYTNDATHYPGNTNLRFFKDIPNISAVLCGHAHCMERWVVDSFPYFVSGAGGISVRAAVANPTQTPAFENHTDFGYILLEVDPLTCKVHFKNVDGTILDSYALYA